MEDAMSNETVITSNGPTESTEASVYSVKVLQPFLERSAEARQYFGKCDLTVGSDRVVLTKKKIVGPDLSLSTNWNSVQVLTNLLTTKRLLKISLGYTELKMKVVQGDVVRLGEQLEKYSISLAVQRSASAKGGLKLKSIQYLVLGLLSLGLSYLPNINADIGTGSRVVANLSFIGAIYYYIRRR
jgi:hypothetical protein